jgi:hypothetical protein
LLHLILFFRENVKALRFDALLERKLIISLGTSEHRTIHNASSGWLWISMIMSATSSVETFDYVPMITASLQRHRSRALPPLLPTPGFT